MFQSQVALHGRQLTPDSLASDSESEPHSSRPTETLGLPRVAVGQKEDQRELDNVSLSGYEHFRSFAFLFDNSIVAFLSAYFDESYSHPPQPLVYTIAGYISEDWRWRIFDREWHVLLKREDIGFFHMTDLAHKKGVYKLWTEKKREQFLKSLHYVIKSNTIIDFAVSVVVKDYDEMIPIDSAIRPGFGEPHVFAAVGCLKDIHNWAEANNIKDRIAYVFEKGAVHDAALRTVFGTFDEAANEHYRSRGVSFFDKRDYAPLQAADILAYENMLDIRRSIDPENTRPMRLSAKNLKRSNSHWVYYDKAQSF